MKLLVFISVLGVIIALGLAAGKISFSYFSDSAVSDGNVFAASAEFPTTPTPTTTPPVSIVINEVFEASNNMDEWIELYNPSNSPIAISGWKIADALTSDTFPTVSPIPSNGYAVIVGQNSNVPTSIPSTAITIELGNVPIGSGLNSDGDAVYLRNNSDVLFDQMSYGDNSDVFPTPPPVPSPTQSLSRIPNGTDTNSSADWQLDSSPTIGTENSL